MTYAIIKVGGKQYRVQEGEKLVVDRLKTEEGKTFTPDLLFVPDGDGSGVTVTAMVVGHVKGDKIRIGKYKRRTGYKKHTGFRASLTQIEIQSIGKGRAAAKPAAPAAEQPAPATPAAQAAPAETPKTEVVSPAASAPAGLPAGYADMKVGDVSAGAKEWDKATLEAALAYEQANANRKGALAALEGALAKEND
jgi:large subunit ribosomal protein L21